MNWVRGDTQKGDALRCALKLSGCSGAPVFTPGGDIHVRGDMPDHTKYSPTSASNLDEKTPVASVDRLLTNKRSLRLLSSKSLAWFRLITSIAGGGI
jgi:hypothetical protein